VGRRLSGIGRPAELAGPLSSSCKSPRATSAKAGRVFGDQREAEKGRVEGHGGLDIVDHVSDVDGGHGLSSSAQWFADAGLAMMVAAA